MKGYIRTRHPRWKYKATRDDGVSSGILCQNIKTEFIELSFNGMLLILKDYHWNGADWSIDTDTNRRPSKFHDALCQLIELGLLDKRHRKAADILYRKMCIAAGMIRLRAWADYYMIRAYVMIKY